MKQTICAIALALLVAACAQPARTSQMIYHADAAQLAEVPETVRNGLTIAAVDGGKETDPLWMSAVGNTEFREALTVTLQEWQLHAFESDAPYALSATLLELEQLLAGFDITVTCRANYLVIRRSDNAEVFNETIVTPYTADFSDAFMAVERLRMANEGAARVNIEAFVRQFLGVAETL